LPSFGEKLKKEREKRSITLEQISVTTKIGTRMLQALEQDKFNQLPGGIFNKGFVRAYARCIGLDEEQTIADYLQASGEAPPSQPDAPPEISVAEPASDSPSRGLPWGVFAAILLIIAIALSIWSYRQRERVDQQPVPAQRAEHAPENAPAASATTSATPPPVSAQPAPITTSSQPVPPSVAPASSAPASSTQSAASAPSVPLTAAAKPPERAPAPGEFVVSVQARENSWVSITADGATIASEVMDAGSEQVVHARRQVIVKTGNTGAVDFIFNGKKLARQGDYGEVKTLTFVPSGLLPKPATPTTDQ
jgi:cytoskeleton protein RodZ